jgi:hypothetical protein
MFGAEKGADPPKPDRRRPPMTAASLPSTAGPPRALVLMALFLGQMVALVLAYQLLTEFDCGQTTTDRLCSAFQGLLARALCAGGAVLILFRARASSARTVS